MIMLNGSTDLTTFFFDTLDAISDWTDAHAMNLVTIIIGAWIARRFGTMLVMRVIKHTVRHDLYPTETDRKKRLKTLESLVGAMIRVGAWIIAGILLIGEIKPNYTTGLFASAGAIGVALGIGAQSLIKDLIAGISIITENQYRVGDVVRLGEVAGVVEAITIRTTVLRDLDGNLHHVPNGTITITSNMTMDFGSINIDIVVDHDTDLDKLEKIINDTGELIAKREDMRENIVSTPKMDSIQGFAPNGVIVKILARTAPNRQWDVRSAFLRELTKAFRKNGVQLPYQQIVIHEADKPAKTKTARK
jgi:small-conductance mechanosensitive channel